MQGLGEIIRANLQAVGLDTHTAGCGRRPGKFGVVRRNGDPADDHSAGTPWRVRHVGRENQVVRVSDGTVLATYVNLRDARKHVSDLILGRR
jgi:hypothetical protein